MILKALKRMERERPLTKPSGNPIRLKTTNIILIIDAYIEHGGHPSPIPSGMTASETGTAVRKTNLRECFIVIRRALLALPARSRSVDIEARPSMRWKCRVYTMQSSTPQISVPSCLRHVPIEACCLRHFESSGEGIIFIAEDCEAVSCGTAKT